MVVRCGWMIPTSVSIITFGPCRADRRGTSEPLLDTALSVIMEPLPKDAPLWSIFLITELADGAAAVVVVLHHVLADGVGGLNVLAALVDRHPRLPVSFPQPSPTRGSLAREAWLTQLREFVAQQARGDPCAVGCLLVEAFTLRAQFLLAGTTNWSTPQDGGGQA